MVVVSASGRRGERPAGHQDDAAAELLDRCHLLLVGADHVVESSSRPPARAGRCRRPRRVTRRARRARRLASGRSARARSASPAHAALRRVHRFGDAEAEPPQVLRGTRIVASQSIAQSSQGSMSARASATTCAAEKAMRLNGAFGALREIARRREVEDLERAAGGGQPQARSGSCGCDHGDALALRPALGCGSPSLRYGFPPVLGLVARRETRFTHCVRCARTIATSQNDDARWRARPRVLRSSAPHMSLPAHTHPRLCRHHRASATNTTSVCSAVGGTRGGRFVGRREAQRRGRRAQRASFI